MESQSMSDRRLLWIRIISGYSVLMGLGYLLPILASITDLGMPNSKELSRFVWATQALLIVYTICFIIGGIGLAFLRKWGRDILSTIFWVDILLKIMVVITPVIFSFISPRASHTRIPRIWVLDIIVYGTLLLEIVIVFYLRRKKTIEMLLPKIP